MAMDRFMETLIEHVEYIARNQQNIDRLGGEVKSARDVMKQHELRMAAIEAEVAMVRGEEVDGLWTILEAAKERIEELESFAMFVLYDRPGSIASERARALLDKGCPPDKKGGA